MAYNNQVTTSSFVAFTLLRRSADFPETASSSNQVPENPQLNVICTIACFLLSISWMDLITVIIGYVLVGFWVSSVILIVYMIFGKNSTYHLHCPLTMTSHSWFYDRSACHRIDSSTPHIVPIDFGDRSSMPHDITARPKAWMKKT